MRKLLVASALVALFASPVVAVETKDQDAAPGYRCAWAKHINSFKLVDDKTVILEQGPGRRYKATLLNTCRDLRFEERIAVKSHSTCLGRGDSLIVRGPGGFETQCFISKIVYLPREKRNTGAEIKDGSQSE